MCDFDGIIEVNQVRVKTLCRGYAMTVKALQDDLIRVFFQILAVSLATARIAVRIKNEKNQIPFFKWMGMDEEFIRQENETAVSTSLDDREDPCLCYAVLKSEHGAIKDHCTEHGSFISNDYQNDMKRLEAKGHSYANGCARQGFQSLGLIPFSSGDKKVSGLFHLADMSKGIFNPEKISNNEQIVKYFLQMLLRIDSFVQTQAAKKMKILIAEDDEAIALLVRKVLDRAGYSCVIAANGKLALDHLSVNRIDLLITDINMPLIDGTELIRSVRDRYGIYGPRIVVLTAMKPGVDPEFMENYSVSALLHKPLDSIFEIGRVVREALAEET